VSLGKTLNAVCHLGTSSLPVVVAQSDETGKQISFCVGSGITDTEHTTSDSNEGEKRPACHQDQIILQKKLYIDNNFILFPVHPSVEQLTVIKKQIWHCSSVRFS